MKGPTLTGQVVLEYLNKYPDASTLMLARMIYRDNVALFTNVEHTRGIIRYYRGASGNIDRKKLKNTNHVRPFRIIEKI